MVTHTADCAECDWRINKVPAYDYEEGAMRPIYLLSGAYPRQVREDRGETWKAKNLEDLQQKSEWATRIGEIIGYIPQARHTYALIEGMYGIMNEHQVSIGESTCASKLWATPMGSAGGKALLEASELSQIALERTTTAKDAIQLMGELAEMYGFYSAAWDEEQSAMGEGGEALSVADKNEAWIFHIIPDNTGTSAIWVAQRVPDDHVAVVANTFIIREIEENNPDFMYSSNLHTIAQDMGYWHPDQGKLNFLKAFVPQRMHPNYSHRRVWRVFSLASPSIGLPPDTNAFADDYPFSIKVDESVSAETVMSWQRDHYEGTPFSLTEGLASGPFGDPNRFDGGAALNITTSDVRQGEFGRAISLFRTSYAVVATPRDSHPDVLSVVWICQV
jgi:dipeptidase